MSRITNYSILSRSANIFPYFHILFANSGLVNSHVIIRNSMRTPSSGVTNAFIFSSLGFFSFELFGEVSGWSRNLFPSTTKVRKNSSKKINKNKTTCLRSSWPLMTRCTRRDARAPLASLWGSRRSPLWLLSKPLLI